METNKCIICEKNDNSPFIEVSDRLAKDNNIYQLVKCKCGFIYLNPRPSESNIYTYYNSGEYDPHKIESNNVFNKIYKVVQWAALKWKKRKISKFYKCGKLLDIGGGNGDFAEFMMLNGWNVVMQDKVSSQFDSIINKNISITENLDSIMENDSFDVITLWHSLEHIHNIKELFLHINRLLSPQGILVIALPNINSPERPFLGENWAPYDAPRHLYHFNLKALHRLCGKYKFDIIRKYSLFQDTPYNVLLSLKNDSLIQYLKGIILSLYSILRTMFRGPTHSSSVVVICKKI